MAPETFITEGEIVKIAETFIQYKKDLEYHKDLCDAASKELKEACDGQREVLLKNRKIARVIRISDAKVEFRMKNGQIPFSDKGLLEELFGQDYHSLFEQGKVISAIIKPNALIKALEDAGVNPWDYLSLNVKEGMDEAVTGLAKDIGLYNTAEAVLPRKGFLSTLAGIIEKLTDDAVEFLQDYLKKALEPIASLKKR